MSLFHHNIQQEKEDALNKLNEYRQEGRISEEEKSKLEVKIEEIINE